MNTNDTLLLRAPMHGVLLPIEKVPDPVFAEKMVGDGVSIDPLEGVLRAPCAGEIIHIHPSGHAVTILADRGIEVMLHIGIDTVLLKGEGFTPLVTAGKHVESGDELIRFDMKLVASKAPYLLTQMIVSTMDLVQKIEPVEPKMVNSGDTICVVFLKKTNAKTENESIQIRAESELIPIPNVAGIHARPAARLAQLLKPFESEVELHLGTLVANAKSITSVMKLNTDHGDLVKLVAIGADAEAVIKSVSPELAAGLGDESVKAIVTQKKPVVSSVTTPTEQISGSISGIAASPGVAIGTVFQLKEPELVVSETGTSPNEESNKFSKAIETAKVQLTELFKSLEKQNPTKAAIFNAHQELLEDPDLVNAVTKNIHAGKSAAYSWKTSYELQAQELSTLQSAVLAGRAVDLRDVGKRVLALILDVDLSVPTFPKGAILIAEDLTPSITAALDPKIVLGFCTTLGGATSHVAILARALGIPAITGCDPRILQLSDGVPVVIDGTIGRIKIDPDPLFISSMQKIQEKMKQRAMTEFEECQTPATTIDGFSVEVVANVGKPSDAAKIRSNGGEGVGLLRSEFLFLDRTTAPTEDEQYESYRSVIEAVGPDSPVVIRTLDVGGDKPLAYIPLPREENPFLGIRGIRVGLEMPELLRTQLRALLRASVHGKLHIMFPMIGDLTELREAKRILEEERVKLNVPPVSTGIMIEVPSAVLLADHFAAEVDFFSIGTNDLTQYTLAMDRGHPKLAAQADGVHPAVLRMIKMTIDAAHAKGKWVGVCGGLAGDPQAVPLLIGLGVDELSASIPAIPSVKAHVRKLSKVICMGLANHALNCQTAEEVRKLSPKPYLEERLPDF